MEQELFYIYILSTWNHRCFRKYRTNPKILMQQKETMRFESKMHSFFSWFLQLLFPFHKNDLHYCLSPNNLPIIKQTPPCMGNSTLLQGACWWWKIDSIMQFIFKLNSVVWQSWFQICSSPSHMPLSPALQNRISRDGVREFQPVWIDSFTPTGFGLFISARGFS